MGTNHSRQPPRTGSSNNINIRGSTTQNTATMSPGNYIPNPQTVSTSYNTRNPPTTPTGNSTRNPAIMLSGNNIPNPSNTTSGDKTLDTVAQARLEQEQNGPWDVQVSYGGDADLLQHFKDCQKNPGHLNFVPVDRFTAENLPFGYHDNNLADLVRAISDLTVRVSVKCVSDRRPETFPESDKPYPCYKTSRRDMVRVGTGWVGQVMKFPNEANKNEVYYCPCCQNKGTPRREFAFVYIVTAAHLVYDELEAAHTTCHLFFDRGDTPNNCLGVETMRGALKILTHIEKDCCFLTFATHDLYLADMLDEMTNRCAGLFERVYQDFALVVQSKIPGPQPNENLARQQETEKQADGTSDTDTRPVTNRSVWATLT